MMSLSFWAARNVWPARILLIISYLILIGMAFMVSDLLYESGTTLPGFLFPAAGIVFIIAAVIYPSKKDILYKKYYFRKGCDLLLVICSLSMIICTGTNRNSNTSIPFSVVSAASTDPSGEIVKSKKKIKKEQLKKLKALYKELKAAYKNGPQGTKALLIVLSSILAAGLILVVLALSCSIACSGSGVLAFLVGFVGTGLIIFLLIRVIRGIRRKYNPLIRPDEKVDEKKADDS